MGSDDVFIVLFPAILLFKLCTSHLFPLYGEGQGIAGLKCWAITFRLSSQSRGNDGVLTLGSLTQGKGGQRAKF